MSMKEFLGKLQDVSGPNGYGEYMAKCPAHDDQYGSLAVIQRVSRKDGKERIYFYCHAGCDCMGIMEMLGLKAGDMIVTP